MSALYRRITMTDVAKKAHVSRTSAARALNSQQHFMVSPKLRERVLAAAEALGYVTQRRHRAMENAEHNRAYVLIPHTIGEKEFACQAYVLPTLQTTLARAAKLNAKHRGQLVWHAYAIGRAYPVYIDANEATQ